MIISRERPLAITEAAPCARARARRSPSRDRGGAWKFALCVCAALGLLALFLLSMHPR